MTKILRLVSQNRPEPAALDGRRRRSQDSRARIVAAMLELIHVGEVAPSAEQVANRAGVGLRTVFRHFNDMESLYAEMGQVIESELLAIIGEPLHAEDPVERMIEIVGRRAAAYEKITPFKRAANVQRHSSAFLAAAHARLTSGAREILKQNAPVALVKDKMAFEAVELLLSWEAWDRLRRDQGLSPRRAREVLEAAVRRFI